MGMEKYIFYAQVFKALSDPKRIMILEQIKEEEKCACVLQQAMDLTQSGLSYHMKILSETHLVISRQEGKWTYYRPDPSGIKNVIEFLKNLSE